MTGDNTIRGPGLSARGYSYSASAEAVPCILKRLLFAGILIVLYNNARAAGKTQLRFWLHFFQIVD